MKNEEEAKAGGGMSKKQWMKRRWTMNNYSWIKSGKCPSCGETMVSWEMDSFELWDRKDREDQRLEGSGRGLIIIVRVVVESETKK
jgi:hypothetical protein